MALLRHGLRLSVPIFGEQLLALAVGVGDTLMVGHLGSAQLAAVSISMQWILLVSMMSMAISIGSTILIAQAVGACDWDATRRTIQQAMLLCLPVGLATMALTLLFAEPILMLMGGTEELVIYGVRYLHFAAGAVLLSGVLNVGNANLRGAGKTRTVLYIVFVVIV